MRRFARPILFVLALTLVPVVISVMSGGGSRAGLAPEIQGIHHWINSGPLTIQGLRNRVVIVDFWTYSCINCIRTIPHLNAWYEKYHDPGLEIVGVHSPEFTFEKDRTRVERAVQDLKIRYPVAMDSDQKTWNAYANHYWPHKYLIDAQGNIRYEQIGEGGYAEFEQRIQELLAERGARPVEPKASNIIDAEITRPAEEELVDPARIRTPEIYFGTFRGGFLGNPKGLLSDRQAEYRAPADLVSDHFYLTGRWDVGEEKAAYTGPGGGKILIQYTARAVHLVAGGGRGPVELEVLLDGKPLRKEEAGRDVRITRAGRSVARIDEARLYRLVADSDYRTRTLTLIVRGRGLEAYTFTFG